MRRVKKLWKHSSFLGVSYCGLRITFDICDVRRPTHVMCGLHYFGDFAVLGRLFQHREASKVQEAASAIRGSTTAWAMIEIV